MHSLLNGTRCRDGVKSVVVSFPSSLIGFLGFHPYMHSEKFSVMFLCFSLFRNGKREERWEGKLRGGCMVCKVRKYRTLLLMKIIMNSNAS